MGASSGMIQIVFVLNESDIHRKLQGIDRQIEAALFGSGESVPVAPARDAVVLRISELPPKPGLTSREGQARLLHDLASIELQATELALRTLIEYPEAPADLRAQLAELALEESRHLRLCLNALDSLGYEWGQWPVHLGLWQATSREDTLLERILIVHCYLEGSGLDAGDSILRRLQGAESRVTREAVGVIVREEVGHVAFGTQWFRKLCQAGGLDVESEFRTRTAAIFERLPRRERLSRELRRAAGFTESQIEALEEIRGERRS